ncbi:MAG: CHRD domain-containing protein [Mojavia pulchra JT2-VF2]|jgi:quercetin dioxygenase-like cupin family protein|uniref:CHRD domain-containing protein n=1 Tax=Mojavia pulchra JT2-VF2 TaxID=287848 RepID=A0A951Q501_9NOST|nr:CHRD domain-containing protein [Mojavia pulchra JT2-VF2]
MTHPINTLPPTSSGQLDYSDHTHDHDTETDADFLSIQDLPVIDDYLIATQDAPLNERPAFYSSGDLYTFLTTSKETNFVFNAFDFFVPPGGGPVPHIHNYEHEAFYVAEGKVNFFLGNEAGITGSPQEFVLEGVPTGTLVFGPRLRPHGFKNIDSTAATSGDNPGARILSITTPGGLDYLFEYAGEPVENRNNPIPPPPQGGFTPGFIEFALRTAYRGPSFPQGAAFPGYQPPAGTPKYVLVLPDDAPQGLKEKIKAQVAGVEGFSIWNASERPKFTGPFGIEYTSLTSFEESTDNLSNNRLSYNQFSLQPQATDTFVQANLNGKQVVAPTKSQATGVANVELKNNGDVNYSLTVKGLDFGLLSNSGHFQTPNNELDDVTSIEIHSGKRGSNDSEVFTIFDLKHHDKDDFNIRLDKDGSATIKGIWDEKEEKIPDALSNFLKNSGLPGQESGFYFEVDTKGHPTGEIRGQIAYNTNDFVDQVESDNYEAFYVKEGQLSFKIGDEVRLVEPNTFVTIAPGTKYSIGNFGATAVKSLAVSVIPEEIKPIIPDDRGYTLIEGSETQDSLVAGSKTKVLGKGGNDTLKIASGGNNLLYGGAGADQFWIADGKLPDTVNDPRQPTYFGLLPLVDTQNTIVDFQLGVDKIKISGINGISSFDDLKLLPAFGDIRSTSIIATLDGKEISLANVTGVLYAELSAKDFVILPSSNTDDGELLNLEPYTGKDVKVTFTVNREAAYNNFVGFYKVQDAQGTITDPVTGNQLKPTDAGYTQLAVQQREPGVNLSVAKFGQATFEDTLKGGSLYAPFLIANANPATLNDDFSKVYLPFIQGNSDKVDHIRLLGANTFGFEDLYGGGDLDFNDMTVQAKFAVV